MKFLRRQRRQKDVKSIRGKNGRLHSLSSLKYRLSRLLFVAPFTFHRQYFRAIWRVDSLAKLKCIERLLFAIQRELLREKNRPTPHPFSILIYTLAQFAHTTCFRRIFSTGCVWVCVLCIPQLELENCFTQQTMSAQKKRFEITKCAFFKALNRCPFSSPLT